jgi:hypothetical protein
VSIPDEYLPCVVALVKLRLDLAPLEREEFAVAARAYSDQRVDYHRLLATLEEVHGVDWGLRLSAVRSDAAAEFVALIFEWDVAPPTSQTYVLGEDRPDYLIATTVQHAYDLLPADARLRFKNAVRATLATAPDPLDAELAYILRLLDSWEAWELEQQLG